MRVNSSNKAESGSRVRGKRVFALLVVALILLNFGTLATGIPETSTMTADAVSQASY